MNRRLCKGRKVDVNLGAYCESAGLIIMAGFSLGSNVSTKNHKAAHAAAHQSYFSLLLSPAQNDLANFATRK
jgi:hypothetical protein